VPTLNAAERTSVRIPLVASTSPEQIAALNDLALRRGFFVVDTGNGVTLIRSDAPGPSAETLSRMLQGDWGRRLGEVLGVEPRNLQQVKVEPLTIDYELEFAAKNAGRGMATRKLLEHTTQRTRDAFDASTKIKDYIAKRSAEDGAYADAMNRPARQDVQLARWILAQHGLEGLKKALNLRLFLPGIVGALGLTRTSDGNLKGDGQ
jgi:hypothetical protein